MNKSWNLHRSITANQMSADRLNLQLCTTEWISWISEFVNGQQWRDVGPAVTATLGSYCWGWTSEKSYYQTDSWVDTFAPYFRDRQNVQSGNMDEFFTRLTGCLQYAAVSTTVVASSCLGKNLVNIGRIVCFSGCTVNNISWAFKGFVGHIENRFSRKSRSECQS